LTKDVSFPFLSLLTYCLTELCFISSLEIWSSTDACASKPSIVCARINQQLFYITQPSKHCSGQPFTVHRPALQNLLLTSYLPCLLLVRVVLISSLFDVRLTSLQRRPTNQITMPHTSRKKRQQREQSRHRNKRGEIESDDGWTRIARSNHNRGINTSDRSVTREVIVTLPDDPDYDPDLDEGDTKLTYVTSPAEIPDGATLEKALRHYQRCEHTWRQSDTWTELKQTFDSRILKQDLDITNCICFGLSSPTGLLQADVDRRNVSMYQLAAFKSVMDILTDKQDQRPEAYAQEPIFNTLDVALLSQLNITVVNHPTAFELITPKSFTFCPGAEQSVTRGTLFRSPAMHMGTCSLETYREPDTGDLRSPFIGSSYVIAKYPRPRPPPQEGDSKDDDEWIEELNSKEKRAEEGKKWRMDAVRGAEILHRFAKGKEFFKLPDAEGLEHALYNTHLYWRSSNALTEDD
jgi:SRR1